MTNKKITLLGKALKALMELKEYDKVKEIINDTAYDGTEQSVTGN